MSAVSLFQSIANENIAPQRAKAKRSLSEADAVDIWIARWLRIRRKDILQRYGCDPRRIYEIWEGISTRLRAQRPCNAFSWSIRR